MTGSEDGIHPVSVGRIGPQQAISEETKRATALNWHSLGPGELALSDFAEAGVALPDLDAIREYRLKRVQQKLIEFDYAGVILYDPVHIRYACDATNMSLWTAHNPARYVWVSADGPMILFDYAGLDFLSLHLRLVDEIRRATQWMYELAGEEMERNLQAWSAELADVVDRYGGGNRRVAIDRASPDAVHALEHHDIELFNAGQLMENARSVKSPQEILSMKAAIVTCENAMRVMQEALEPGMSEQELWAIFHAENIKRGGEWIETRLLNSGPRTNSWFQEASARVIENGDLVAFDTDLIGNYGICVDMSRTWIAGDRDPNANQQDVFSWAVGVVEANTDMIRPGTTFRELTFDSRLEDTDEFHAYSCQFHGVGLADEWPMIYHPHNWDTAGHEGELVPGMVMSVETFVGRKGWGECVKLEEMVLVTDGAPEILSHYPVSLR